VLDDLGNLLLFFSAQEYDHREIKASIWLIETVDVRGSQGFDTFEAVKHHLDYYILIIGSIMSTFKLISSRLYTTFYFETTAPTPTGNTQNIK
jgi:hypothetical protein